ncbi:MAG: non-canonical purine NTP pyrophosphatase, RdgB/HAM1 family [Arachnia propionica]|nr:MAG: non-canonical purine NTP pyrophosphatase, RdgB/HAM1 family [Arachnia propionica]
MKPRQVVLASGNPGKLAELRRLVAEAGLGLEVLGLGDFEPYAEPAETERTFEGNARLKAQAAAAHTGLPAIADDSGLAVDELNDMPGVRSARWAGPQRDDLANLELLLRQLDGVPATRRGARFVCALVLATPDGHTRTWHGAMPGHINTAPVGENGFGYDPIFVPEGYEVTSAQLSASAKDAISHRGQAVRSFLAWLKED